MCFWVKSQFFVNIADFTAQSTHTLRKAHSNHPKLIRS